MATAYGGIGGERDSPLQRPMAGTIREHSETPLPVGGRKAQGELNRHFPDIPARLSAAPEEADEVAERSGPDASRTALGGPLPRGPWSDTPLAHDR